MTDKDAGRRIELFRQIDELSRCQAIANASKRCALRIEGWIGLGATGAIDGCFDSIVGNIPNSKREAGCGDAARL